MVRNRNRWDVALLVLDSIILLGVVLAALLVHGILKSLQRLSSSSGETSSTCVATHQMLPAGSLITPYRSRGRIDGVAVGHIQVDRGWHGAKLCGCVGQHQHRISNSHLCVDDCAIWAALSESHLAAKCYRDELHQP